MTLDDVKRVAKRLFDGQELIVTIVGKPVGLAVPTSRRVRQAQLMSPGLAQLTACGRRWLRARPR